MTPPSLTSSGAGPAAPRGRRRGPPPPRTRPIYPAAIRPSGPKATLVTRPSLTSSGAGRSRSPRASKRTTPPPPPRRAISGGDPALGPEGHARNPALLDLQRRVQPLPARVEEDHAAAAAAAAISGGDPAVGPEGHARNPALLDLQRREPQPLPARSKRTTPPPTPALYPAAIRPSGPKATLLTEPSLTSSGAGRSRCPRASKRTTPPLTPRPTQYIRRRSGPRARRPR